MSKIHVLIVCAGNGKRFGSDIPKQYQQILDKPVIYWTLVAFVTLNEFATINIIVNCEDKYIDDCLINFPTVNVIRNGGKNRAQTVLNGLKALECSKDDWVLIHDGARCCINKFDILNLINSLKNDEVGGILATKATDTIKQVKPTAIIIEQTIDRNQIYYAQTPQMFKFGILYNALQNNCLTKLTDEANAIELQGLSVKIIASQYPNLKITFPQDIYTAECILKNLPK